MDKQRISKSQFQAPTMPAPWIPVLEQSNKGGLGVDELRRNPPVPVRVTSLRSPGIIVNSTLTLYWDGIVVDQYVMSQEQYDTGMVNFDVMPSDIADGVDVEIYYTSITPEGVNPTVSESYFVRVNTTVPGNPPLNPTDPINTNLQPPRDIPKPVTDANSASGITVTIPNWVNMEVGDVLTLTWGQTRIPFGRPLEQADLDHPLTIHVSQATILANSNTLGLKVFYDIRDIVGNWSLNSPPFLTDVEAGPNTMPAVRVTEADVNGDIDLSRLGTGNAHVTVPVYTPWTALDHVAIRWHGLTAAGTSVDETVEFNMTPDDEGFPVTREIQNATVTAIAGGTAVVYYEVNNVRRSRRKALTVSGAIPPLTKPQVLEAQNGELDPATLPAAGATVGVPQYPGMALNDRIYLYWDGTTAAGDATHYTADQVVTTLGFVTFSVPTAANVTPLAGGSVKIYYTVVSGLVSRTSETLDLDVKRNESVQKIDDFNIPEDKIISTGGTFPTVHTQVLFHSGTGVAGVSLSYDPVGQGANPALFQRPALQVCIADIGSQTIQIDLREPWVEVTINAFGAIRGATTLEFRDDSDQILSSITPSAGSPSGQTLRHSTTGAAAIRYLRIIGQENWTVWDNINMRR
jgi:hypothetical protein